MAWFYDLYSVNPQQVVVDLEDNEKQLSLGKDYISESVFFVPWGHHIQIIGKCRDDQQKALFYVEKVIENHWSRAVLLNFLDTDLYERQRKAITNFKNTLPEVQSDLAQEMTRDPYNFDFLTLTERYNEKELKDALMDNITKFLLELGSGFSFVGREYRVEIGDKENFIDMLFFNINLKCYVVLEVKVTEFEPSFAGQLGTYVVAVNHQLKPDNESALETSAAAEAIRYFDRIYHEENLLSDMTAEERYEQRLAKVKPLLDAFFAWLETLPVSGKGKLADAVRYALNEKPFLYTFLENGNVPIDNNRAENAIRPFAVGRKNWMHSNTAHGATCSAALYSIVATAQANGLDTEKYLTELFSQPAGTIMLPQYMIFKQAH